MRDCVIGMLIGNRLEEVLRSCLRVAVIALGDRKRFLFYLTGCKLGRMLGSVHGGRTWIPVDVT
ncbi:MAG: hypothetical protein H0X25_04370 [Acidobacteriales bacterium]|nr:hypothetical protein [Terriglobales bacterium]